MRALTLVSGRWFAFVLTGVLVAYWVAFCLHWSQTGWDFPVFYVAASLPTHAVYSRAAFVEYWQQHLAPLGVPHWARFVRLPVFGLLLRPLAALPYTHAMWVWMTAGLVAYCSAIAMLVRRFQLPPFLFPLFVAFYPALVGLISGQDNCLLLVAVVAGWLLLESRRDALAGFVFALCLYKFNLIVLIAPFLLLQKRLRAFGAFAAVAILITAASFAITPLRTYLTALVEVQKETAGFFPFGLRGLSLVLGQNWCFPFFAAIVFLLCCWAIWRSPLTEAFCVAVTGALLIVPYVCWYDSTLLVVPLAFILARGSIRMRVVCVAALILGPAWRFLVVHLAVELLILAYFLRAAATLSVLPDFASRIDPVPRLTS